MIYYIVLILLALGDLFFWWWGDRRLQPLRKAAVWRVLLGLLVGGQFIVMFWSVFFAYTMKPGFWKPVSAWMYMWHLLVLPATLLCLFFGYLILWLGNSFGRLVDWRPGSASLKSDAFADRQAIDSAIGTARGPAVVYPSRRQILAAAAAFAPQVALGGGLLKAASQAGKFRIRRLEIALANLPVALSGLTIAHVSDTHIGRFLGPKELVTVVEATAALKPDLIAFTGDLIDFNLCDLDPGLDAMRDLQKIAPMAMCVGNHDLFADPTEFRRRVRNAELGLLLDESMPLTIRGERIELLGLDWGLQSVPRADGISEHMNELLTRRGSTFPILLAHHPHAFDPAAAAGIPLTLSGHTHGGQIMITKNFGAGRVYRYWSGLYSKGASKLVVSNGVGNWFPLRINAPAEIVHLTLRKA